MQTVAGLTAAALVVANGVASSQKRELGPDVRMHSAIASKFLSKPRDVLVWLPPGYATETSKRYPVLYMHDGSNVYIEWRHAVRSRKHRARRRSLGGLQYIANVKELRDALVRKGWTSGTDFMSFEAPGDTHDDVSFGKRSGEMLKFLFPPPPAK